MIDEPLVTGADLVGFRGAPFADAVVRAASDGIRAECGWHIAPSIQQTVKLPGGGPVLAVESLHVTAVASITDRDGAPVEGWEWFQDGTIERHSGVFPRWVTVVFTHGYTVCPRELLPVVAERAGAGAAGRIKSEALSGRSVVLEGGYDPASHGVLAKYRLEGGP